jgi:hypothetical protein
MKAAFAPRTCHRCAWHRRATDRSSISRRFRQVQVAPGFRQEPHSKGQRPTRRARNGVRRVCSPIPWPDALPPPTCRTAPAASVIVESSQWHFPARPSKAAAQFATPRRRPKRESETRVQTGNVSRNDGNADARYNDDGRPDDARRPSRLAWPADIPRKRTEFSPSCRPWFSPRRERHLHTDASHRGCRPGAPHRCPGRPHRPGNKPTHRPAMQARKPNG